MKRESFIFYKSFYEASKYLSKEQKGELFDMICKYGFYGEQPTWDWLTMWMFLLIQPQINANNKRYKNWCKGGAPKGNKNAVKNLEKNTKQLNNQKTTKKQPNDNDNVNENENEKDIDVGVSPSPLETALVEFWKYRKKIKKEVTSDDSKKRIISHLNNLWKTDEEKIAIIHQTIDSWRVWLFPLKEPLSTEPKTNGERVAFFDKCRDEWTHRAKILDVYGREKFEKVKHLRCEWCATWVVDEKFKL